jgi:transposase
VSDEEWAFVVPYLTLRAPDALPRKHALREVFNGVRYRDLVRTGAPWRSLPTNFSPWPAVDQQARRWRDAGCFAALTHDLRMLLRARKGRAPQPTATMLDARACCNRVRRVGRGPATTAISGARAPRCLACGGRDVGASAGPLGVTPANEDERTQVATLAEQVQAVPGAYVASAFVDQGYTGEDVAHVAEAQGIPLPVVSLPAAKRGFVLLPRRWLVERFFAWTARFRRLARDDARLPQVLAGLHFLAVASLMLHQLIQLYSSP